jgi:2-polyprenyl-6-methoxyphenol hydroxylase-like FAD-dependent oxidoreductase
LLDALKPSTDIRFDATIQDVLQHDGGVIVQLSGGGVISADVLLVAEGIRSSTRAKLWKDTPVGDLDMHYAAGMLHGEHGYEPGLCLYYRCRKKMLAIIPLSKDQLAIQCHLHNSVDSRIQEGISAALLADIFRDLDPSALALIGRLERGSGIYSDRLGMVHPSVLYNGKVVLLGDAGYSPTSLSGMGASLAIYGAKTLASCISQSPEDLSRAFHRYNAHMLPIAQQAQSLAQKNARSLLPMSNTSLFLNNLLLRYTPSSLIARKMAQERIPNTPRSSG